MYLINSEQDSIYQSAKFDLEEEPLLSGREMDDALDDVESSIREGMTDVDEIVAKALIASKGCIQSPCSTAARPQVL